jgi:GGDEF domain-containing protein
MSLAAPEGILLIGDTDRHVQSALAQAMPAVQVTCVPNPFDGVAELCSRRYTTVLAATEPIERRPEAAVRTMRQLVGNGRLLLYGHPTLEPLSRKMLAFGADDYIVTPASAGELLQVLGAPLLRLTSADTEAGDAPSPLLTSPPGRLSLFMGLPLAEMVMDAMLQQPHDAISAAVQAISSRISPQMQLLYSPRGKPSPPDASQGVVLSHIVRGPDQEAGNLHLVLPRPEAGAADDDESAARHYLAQLAHLLGKLASLEDRHGRLQKLAITDELTGLYNSRYFRHFLARVLDKARQLRFPVTLLLFDIDDFKKYNDAYGHGVGDEILRQTAALMRRCCREHDLVARIGGDEFAAVFWEKDGPRQPREPRPANQPVSRVPQTPLVILDRFRRLLADPQYSTLGSTGKGTLTISGGLAVYPFDAADVQSLIDAADNALMFGAKTGGKNSIYLVGRDDAEAPRDP